MDDIAVIEGKILLADDQLEKLPSEIRFDEAYAGEKLLKLNHEKKRFLDCIKVFVCNSRAEMCRLLLKHYDRPKEVIPALAMIVERTGYVKLEGGRLEVTLRRFTDREIDYAARHLCEDLNRTQQELAEPVFRPQLIFLSRLPRSYQISQRLMRRVRYPHRRQLSGPIIPRQL